MGEKRNWVEWLVPRLWVIIIIGCAIVVLWQMDDAGVFEIVTPTTLTTSTTSTTTTLNFVLGFMVLGFTSWYLDEPREELSVGTLLVCYLFGWFILAIIGYVKVTGREDYIPHWSLCLLSMVPPVLAVLSMGLGVLN